MSMKPTYSTAQVATAISVNKSTLLRWLYAGKLKEPRTEEFGGVVSRVWSQADLDRAMRYRQEHYRKRS
jgi:predicted site-specific integrase-resolvase